MINAALVAALALASQLQTHPTGLPSIGPSRANSLRTAPIMDKLYEQAGKPALDFDFARYKDLHDNASGATSLVTFSRSAAQSPGTYVGSDGLIHDAAVNLALYSEQFENAAWTKHIGATIHSNVALAPDGKFTADRLNFIADPLSRIEQPVNLVAGTYVISVWMRTESGSRTVAIRPFSGVLLDVTVTTDWQRFEYSAYFSGGLTYPLIMNNISSAGSVLVWGAQLEETDPATMAPTAYIHTTSQALAAPRFDHVPTTGNLTTNLATYSEMLDTQWALGNMEPVQSNVATAPDGTTTAEKLIPNTTNTGHYFYPSPVGSLGSGTFTYSAYVKAAGYPRFGIRVYDGSAYRIRTTFDIEAGTIVLNQAGTPSIEDVGDGWFRVAVTGTSPSGNMGATSQWTLEVLPATNTVQTAFSGDGTSGAYVWGAQIEKASTPGPYVRTLSETRSISDANAESLGLLVEEQRTNQLQYSEEINNGYWTKRGTVSITANAEVAPDGTQTADLVSGLELSGNDIYNSDYITNTAYSPGVEYSPSFWIKKVSTTGIVRVHNPATESAGRMLVDLSLLDGEWNRITKNHPAVTQDITFVGTTPSSRGGIYLRANAAGPLSFYLWGLQAEANASFPTSYIPTEGSAQTRYADVAAVQDEDFSTTNLLAYSESFDVGWTANFTADVIPNTILAPDGQTTADKLREVSTNTSPRSFYQTISVPTSAVFSVYAKKGERNWIRLKFGGASDYAYFNLDDGTIGTKTASSHATIEDVGDGWYRCVFYDPDTTGGSNALITLASADNVDVYPGEYGKGAYVWGASLTATEYPVEYVTTRNLLTDSQDFERSSWVKGGASIVISYDAASAPDGTISAVQVGGPTYIYRFQTVLANTPYTNSIYAKSAGNDAVGFYSQIEGNGSYRGFVVDLTTDTVTSNTFTATPQIEDVGNGWHRISITETGTTNATRITAYWDTPGTTDPLLFWGAQLEPGTTPTDYVRTVDVVGKDYGWYEPTEGTVFVEADNQHNLSSGDLYTFANENNPDPRIAAARSSSTIILSRYYDGSSQADLTRTVGSPFSHATGYGYNYFSAAADGLLATPDTSGNVPSPITKLHFKYPTSSGATWNSHIKRLTYWPRRQSDSTLQVITQ